jgi:hypothetical protein
MALSGIRKLKKFNSHVQKDCGKVGTVNSSGAVPVEGRTFKKQFIDSSAASVAAEYGKNKVLSWTNALILCRRCGMACCQVDQSATTPP